MNQTSTIVTLGKRTYERTEDEKNIYFKDISNNPIKLNMEFSKDKKDNNEAIFGLKTFWTEVFS